MRRSIFGVLVLALVFAGCEKDVDKIILDPINPVDQITFKASAFVEVTDAAGLPVAGATLRIDGAQFTTDEGGLAHLEDVNMHPATYLVAEKSGYFHGSRRFYPTAGNTHYVRIKLLSDYSIGSVDASSGGTVSAGGGLSITFPANAVARMDGSAYSGEVQVSAQPITADDPDLSDKMPGDLVGVTDEGVMGALASMGMVAVELRSETGELLNVKEGSAVELRLDVPAEFLGKAPATIPMWYFDEVRGVWNEDGRATLQGGQYVAEVEHFTYWNYDAWFPITKWGATFLYEDGSPAAQVSVCITILELQTSKCALTDENGFVCGMVASDEPLLLEVKDPCGNVVFSENIGPFSDTTMTGPYTIPEANVNTTEISGSVEDCDGNAVSNGFVRIQVGATNFYVDLESDGTFSTTTINCNESDVVITAIDEANLKQSLPLTYAYAEVIDAGVITACENLTEFIDIELEGVAEHTVFVLPYAYVSGNGTSISSQDSLQNEFVWLNIPGTSAGTYPQISAEISVEVSPGVVARNYGTPISAVITYFGDVGDYIIGTFSGTLSTNPQGGGTDYPMTGTFSVIRN